MYSDKYSPVNRLEKYRDVVEMRIDIEAYWAPDPQGDWRLVIFYDKHNVVYHELGNTIFLTYSSELERGN